MANRSGPSITSGLGWGASLLIVLGLFAHRASQPSVVPHPETREPAKVSGLSAGGSSDTRRTDAGVELQASWSAHFRPSSPPEYLRPIAQFLGMSVEELCTGQLQKSSPVAERTASKDKTASEPAKTSEAYSWANRWGQYLLDYKPRFLIALVPDPDRSRSAYRFDLWVEALQRAANAPDPDQPDATFVLDHYYLPWRNSGDSEVREPHRPATSPGILLFHSIVKQTAQTPPSVAAASGDRTVTAGETAEARGPSRGAKTLVVFLVGDSPIGGIQKRALATSLDIIAWFKRNARDADYKNSLGATIVGPAFSGSQLSLERALQAWWNGHAEIRGSADQWTVDVIGTATALDPERFDRKHQTFLIPSPRDIGMRTTSIPDSILVEALLHYVERTEEGGQPLKIAHLRESNTGFGASTDTPLMQGDLKAFHQRLNIIDIPFPLHISRVEAKHDEAIRQDEASLPHFHAFDRGLRIPTNETEGADDSVPEQDQVMTAVYQDISLSAALETLAKFQPPYILISATDPRDKIFLASVVKSHCPNARLLLTIGDQLYTHSDYVRYLPGAYVVSCYPLSPVLVASGPDVHREMHLESFGENLAFAYYNAVAAHLKKRRALLFYQSSSLKPGASERVYYDGPPIWLSQVGPDRADVIAEHRPEDWLEQSNDTAADSKAAREPKQRHQCLDAMQYVWLPDRGGKTENKPATVPAAEQLHYLPSSSTFWWPIWLWGTNVALLIVLSYAWDLVRAYREAAGRYDPSLGERSPGDVARGRHRLTAYLCFHLLAVFAIGSATGYIAGIVLKPEYLGAGKRSSWYPIIHLSVESPWGDLIPTFTAIVLFSILIIRDLWCWLFRDLFMLCVARQSFVFQRVQAWMTLATLFAFPAFYVGIKYAPWADDAWGHARVTNVIGWNSPLIPFFLIIAVLLGWCWLNAFRIWLLNDFELQWDPLEAEFERRCAASPQFLESLAGKPANWTDMMKRLKLAIAPRRWWKRAVGWFASTPSRWWHRAVETLKRKQVGASTSKCLESLEASTGATGNWIDRKLQDLSDANDKVFVACSDFNFPLPNKSVGTENVPAERWKIDNAFLIAGLAITVYGVLSVWPLWVDGPDERLARIIGIGIVFCWVLLAWEMGRIWDIWKQLRKLHRTAARLPMQHVFTSLPEYFVRCYGDLVFVERFRDGSSPAIDQQFELALRARESIGHAPFSHREMNQKKPKLSGHRGPGSWIREYCRYVVPEIKDLWSTRQVKDSYICTHREEDHKAIASPEHIRHGVSVDVGGSQDDSALQAAVLSQPSESSTAEWSHVHVERSGNKVVTDADAIRVAVDRPQTAAVQTAVETQLISPIAQQVLESDERLFGMMLVAYFSQYRLQLKALALFLAVGPILLLLATASYSFAPQGRLMDFSALLGLACLIVLARVYAGLNGDEFVSLVSGTAPRWYALSADSVTTFLVIILPLILTLASTLPGGNVVYDWMSSLIRSIPSQS